MQSKVTFSVYSVQKKNSKCALIHVHFNTDLKQNFKAKVIFSPHLSRVLQSPLSLHHFSLYTSSPLYIHHSPQNIFFFPCSCHYFFPSLLKLKFCPRPIALYLVLFPSFSSTNPLTPSPSPFHITRYTLLLLSHFSL